jgi:hypothetical protein
MTRLAPSLLLCAAVTLGAALAHAEPYPRVACYAALRSNGAPLVRADGTLDSLLCKRLARYPVITLDLNAVLARPDIALTLRRYNPRIRILGYALLTHWWLPADFVPRADDSSFNADWHRALVATGGFLPDPVPGYEVDWAAPAVADTLTSLLSRAAASRLFNGFFGDYMAPTVAWGGIGTPYTDSLRVVHMRALAWKLREAGGCDFVVVGNGHGAERLALDGTFCEGFPTPLTTFEQAQDWARRYDAPWNWLQGGTGSNHHDYRKARYVAGVSCLWGVIASFGPDRDISVEPPYHGWWFDEYAVTPVNGAWGGIADTTGRHVGWLGEAAGPAYQTPEGAYRRDFAHGLVLVNPADTAVVVNLIAPRWRRIRGRLDPVTNHGRQERLQRVPGRDAVFMLHVPKPKAGR